MNEEQQPPKVSSSTNKTLMVSILTAMITALIASGGVYAYEKNQTTKNQNDLQTQIDSLKSQIATIATAMPTATPTATATPPPTPVATTVPTDTPMSTPVIPTNWQKYTDPNAKYTIYYPQGYTATDETTGNSTGGPVFSPSGATLTAANSIGLDGSYGVNEDIAKNNTGLSGVQVQSNTTQTMGANKVQVVVLHRQTNAYNGTEEDICIYGSSSSYVIESDYSNRAILEEMATSFEFSK